MRLPVIISFDLGVFKFACLASFMAFLFVASFGLGAALLDAIFGHGFSFAELKRIFSPRSPLTFLVYMVLPIWLSIFIRPKSGSKEDFKRQGYFVILLAGFASFFVNLYLFRTGVIGTGEQGFGSALLVATVMTCFVSFSFSLVIDSREKNL